MSAAPYRSQPLQTIPQYARALITSSSKKYQQSNLKPPKMYIQSNHNQSLLSQQSSDIAINPQPALQQTFKSSKEEISNVSLFQDLPLKLLYDPQQQGVKFGGRDGGDWEEGEGEAEGWRQEGLGKTKGYFVFDSVVFDGAMIDWLIQEERRNVVLKAEIQALVAYEKKYRDQYVALKSKKEGKLKAIKTSQQLFNKINLDTEKLSKYIAPQSWFSNPKKSSQNRKQATNLTLEALHQQQKALEDQIKTLEAKKLKITQQLDTIKKETDQVTKQINNQRLERRKNLIAIHIENQNKEISSLKEAIQKMQKLLGRS